ncbi:MAG TPA: autotransporter domain-containing protein, partial [Rhizomicrobium sp.]|nr:autotransporter domain-containing protein [Rhizomicrobium sp.]
SVNGSIATSGDYAHGVFAQSVGGGGGLAGSIEAATLVLSDPFGLTQFDTGVPFMLGSLNFSQISEGVCDTPQPQSFLVLPGPGPSNCGNGGNITVSTTGDITTTGKAAYGIFAQSVAGGGGAGGEQSGVAFIGSNGGDGTAGTITINHQGNIQVFGEDSIGILAQSISGANATTHIESGGRGGDITITVDGIVQGGSGAGAGVFISGGDQNTLNNNNGDIFALSGLAVIGSDGDDTINNAGTITGSVGLGAGTNAFVNEVGGLFEPGKAVYLGVGNTFTNSGTISVGGTGAIGATLLTGNFVQTSSGMLISDVDYATGASDLITVDGDASLAGKAAIVAQDITAVKPGSYFTVLNTTGTLTDNGITIDDTLVVDYGVKFAGQDFQVGVNSVQFDFGGPLSPDQQKIGNYIQTLWQHGAGTALTPLLDYLAGLTDAKAYANLLNHVDPSTGLNQWTGGLLASFSSINNLMSCPGTTDADSALREHECYWARASGSSGTRDTTSSQLGFNSSGFQYAMGKQIMLSPGWFLGGSASFAQNFTDTETVAHEKSVSLSAGAVVKHEDGNWLFAGALNMQYGWNDLTRYVAFPVPATTATSSPNQLFLDGRLRTAYLASSGDLYFKPWVAADLYYSSVPGVQEKGAGPLDLIVSSASKAFGSGTVGVEVGALETTSDGGSLRPYVTADATTFTSNSWDISARFAGAPAGTPNFTVTNHFPGVLGRVAGGVEFNLSTGSLRLEYEHRFGDHYSDQTGSIKLRFPL